MYLLLAKTAAGSSELGKFQNAPSSVPPARTAPGAMPGTHLLDRAKCIAASPCVYSVPAGSQETFDDFVEEVSKITGLLSEMGKDRARESELQQSVPVFCDQAAV